jgi:hypothetical protein
MNGAPFPSVFPVRFLPLLADAQLLASSRSSIDALGMAGNRPHRSKCMERGCIYSRGVRVGQGTDRCTVKRQQSLVLHEHDYYHIFT